MIHVWNRAELTVTYDRGRLYQVCEGLADADIDYIYRTKDLASPSACVEYKIYTRREDVDRARALL